MTIIDDQGRPEPPDAGTELETLLGFLDFQRATLEWKTRGLSDEQLRARMNHPTQMTLGGLLHHIAVVENFWFEGVVARTPGRYDDDVSWDWAGADLVSGEVLREQWEVDVARSRAIVEEQVASSADPLSTTFARGEAQLSLRWIVTHMIEEYSRHNGHADLLREYIDGQTGE